MRSLTRTFFLGLLALITLSPLAHGQSAFPSRTVKFIVPFPAGGINDVLARIVSDKLRPNGAADHYRAEGRRRRQHRRGYRGPGRARRPHPAGRATGATVDQPNLYKKLSYRPEDFVPITILGAVANVAFVKKELPVQSLKELVPYIKSNPGKINYGSQGNGATPHLTANMFMTMTGTQMVHVPNRGETLVYQTCSAATSICFSATSRAAWRSGATARSGHWRCSTRRAPRRCPRCRPSRRPACPT